MAHNLDINSIDQNNSENTDFIQLEADDAGKIDLSEGLFIGDADISRDGQDLILEFSEGESFSVEGYFSNAEDILIEDAAGSVLTEGLVDSFMHSSPEYAQAGSMTDESPVGAVEELKGDATVTHTDGTTDTVTLGTPIYQGDVIQTSGDGAVNIIFTDETSMAISENARLAVDNYKFDATTESGETNLSVLRGVFVYTSGLIGRDDPDDVEINTPVGSIGIRGTIIAGHINPEGESEISVLEGAIVIRNGSGERTLSQQYESVKLSGFQDAIEYKGVEAANDIGETYGSVGDVLPKLFSSINDAAAEEEIKAQETEEQAEEEAELEAAAEEEIAEEVLEEQKAEDLQEATIDPTQEPLQETVEFGVDTEVKETILENTETKEARPDAPKGAVHQKAADHEVLYNGENVPEGATFHFKETPVFEHAKAGQLVAEAWIGNAPAGVTFSLANTSHFDLVILANGSAEVRLNGAGQTAANSPHGVALTGTTITATFANGETVDWTVAPITADAAVHLNAPGGLDYDIGPGVHSSAVKLGDFDNDGDNDTAFIDGSGVHVNGADYTSHTSVDVIGDIDNDGLTDVIIGNPSTANGSVDVRNHTGSIQTNNGGNTGDQYGASVSGAGDFDGDGKSDYIVGAPGTDNGGTDRGEASIITSSGTVNITTGVTNAKLGSQVDGIGDVNGDGFSDVLIHADGPIGANNEAYVIFGNNTGNIDTSSLSVTEGFKISVPSATHEIVAGGFTGDVNGDGFDDFSVSLKDIANNDINTYVVYGHGDTPTDLDLTILENPENALKIHHAGAGSAANYQITALGDLDGDGFDDIQVGVKGGQNFVVHGDLGGNALYVTDGAGNDGAGTVGDPDGSITATANDQSLVGNVNFNDGNNDYLRMNGGGGNNTFEINNNNFKRIDGGNGFDTIKLVQSGDVLDFTTKNFEQIQQIEAIEFGVAGTGQTITLSAENIFNMLKSSDNGELKITGTGTLNLDDLDGTSGGTIAQKIMEVLDEGGTGTASDMGGGHYQVGGYDLYIDPTVTVNVV